MCRSAPHTYIDRIVSLRFVSKTRNCFPFFVYPFTSEFEETKTFSRRDPTAPPSSNLSILGPGRVLKSMLRSFLRTWKHVRTPLWSPTATRWGIFFPGGLGSTLRQLWDVAPVVRWSTLFKCSSILRYTLVSSNFKGWFTLIVQCILTLKRKGTRYIIGEFHPTALVKQSFQFLTRRSLSPTLLVARIMLGKKLRIGA